MLLIKIRVVFHETSDSRDDLKDQQFLPKFFIKVY